MKVLFYNKIKKNHHIIFKQLILFTYNLKIVISKYVCFFAVFYEMTL